MQIHIFGYRQGPGVHAWSEVDIGRITSGPPVPGGFPGLDPGTIGQRTGRIQIEQEVVGFDETAGCPRTFSHVGLEHAWARRTSCCPRPRSVSRLCLSSPRTPLQDCDPRPSGTQRVHAFITGYQRDAAPFYQNLFDATRTWCR